MQKFVFLFIISFITCKPAVEKTAFPALLQETLSEFPKELLSVRDPVFFTFINVPDFDPASNEAVTLSPEVKGEIRKMTDYSYAFYPESPLDYNKKYELIIRLDKVFQEQKTREILKIPFATRKLEFSVSPSPELIYFNDYAEMSGTIYSSDWVRNEIIEDVLAFSREDIPVTWDHSVNGKVHNYLISNIPRGEKTVNVSISWNSHVSSFSGKKDYMVKPLGTFDFMGLNINRENRTVKLLFSDPVNTTQRLEGLITVSGDSEISNVLATASSIVIYFSRLFNDQREIRISDQIKSVAGATLENSIVRSFQFDPVKPEVRLAGSGVITPFQEEVIFPFEAIGLHAVDVEIFKIFESNVLQYLQNNRLNDRSYYLEQVGRIIHQQMVPLVAGPDNPDYDQWTRYVLDLQQFTRVSPGALYVIRIGFRQDYTSYPCSDGISEGPLVLDHENPESIMRWNYNYDGYNYEQETDPCYPVYYNENRFIQRNLLASNLGVISKMGENGIVSVHVNDINTLSPVEGATVSLFDYQKQPIITYQTDNLGRVKLEVSQNPSFMIIKKGNEYSYLNMMDANANSLSDFDIGGLKKQNGLNGYIYGERGVWRPGDTLFLTFVLEDELHVLPDNHPVQFRVNDARGQLKYEQTVTSGIGGMYVFKVATEPSDGTGIWTAIASVGNNRFTSRLRIETVKPNRLKINLDIPDPISIAKDVNIPFSSTWLHGALAGNLSTTVDVTFTSANTSFPSFGTYTFTDPARQLATTTSNVLKGALDSQGRGTIVLKRNPSFLPPGKVNLRFKTRVYEPSGEYSEDNISVIADPYVSYVGLKCPESSWGYNLLNREGDEVISFIVLDDKGEPVPDRKISIGLYEAEWEWWYSGAESGIFRYDAANHLGSIASASLVTDTKGMASWRPESIDGYRYLVRACDEVSGHCSGILFYTSYYDNQTNEGGASILRLNSDKDTYTLGEEITLNVPSNENSRILISVEGGSGIIRESWYDGQAVNTKISLPVEDGMSPNVYIHATLVQKHNSNLSDLPLRMYGVLPLTIEDPTTILDPEIKGPGEIRPEKPFAFEISENQGREMYYTLAIVDEGLLGLTRYKTPDLHKRFYAKQSLGVKTWDIYDMILQGYGNNVQKYISIGGDGDQPVEPGDPKANRFKPVVKFLGPFHLREGERKSHQLTLENYLGEVRVMVVARNKQAYGSENISVPVNNPVMILATVPRVLSPNEEFALPVTVFAADEKISKVDVSLSLGPGLSSTSIKNQIVTFRSKGEDLIHFPLKVDDFQGPSFIKVTARSGTESVEQLINIDIRNPNPFTYRVTDEKIVAGATATIPYSPFGIQGSNSGTLELSTFPAINLDSRLDYLIKYPYGCIEQTTSSVFPQLYLDKIVSLSEDQKNTINRNIHRGINRIITFQQSSGGLSFWKGGSEISEWGTSYAGHFMIEAQEKGFAVPVYFMNSWISFQKKLVNQFSNELHQQSAYLMQAYRLYTLARTGNPEWGAMNSLRNTSLDNTSLYMLAAAYAAAAKTEVAKSLIEGNAYQVKDYHEMAYTYGSALRDKALVAESFLSFPGDVDENTVSLVREVAQELGENSWYSTQTTAFALLAVGKYLSRESVGEVNAIISINGVPGESIVSNKAIFQRTFSLENVASGNISIKNNSSGSLFARVVLRGQEPLGTSPASNENLKMMVQYTDLKGNNIDITNLERGTDFISEVTVINPGTRGIDLEEMALTQVFPSGWEIQNDRISGNEWTVESDHFDYLDIRDDRVNIFFDLKTKKTFRTLLTATYAGDYFLPDVQCVAMYDQKVLSRKPGQWVKVTSSSEQ